MRISSFFCQFLYTAVCSAVLLSSSASAAQLAPFVESGTSTLGTPLTVSAKFVTSTSGTQYFLTLTLSSINAAPTVGKADVLSSFYFNIADPETAVRPVLTLVSGTGQAYQVHKTADGGDQPFMWSPATKQWTSGTGSSDLIADDKWEQGWQFKTISSPPPVYPGLGFGMGTVGNSNIAAFVPGATAESQFDPKWVSGEKPSKPGQLDGESMINLGIYSAGALGNSNPDGGLAGHYLVRNQAVFTFLSSKDLDNIDGSWIQGNVTFGFGTNPETVFLPEPGTLPMLASAGLFAFGWVARRRTRRGDSGSPPQAFPQAFPQATQP